MILTLNVEENKPHFQHIIFFYFKKGKKQRLKLTEKHKQNTDGTVTVKSDPNFVSAIWNCFVFLILMQRFDWSRLLASSGKKLYLFRWRRKKVSVFIPTRSNHIDDTWERLKNGSAEMLCKQHQEHNEIVQLSNKKEIIWTGYMIIKVIIHHTEDASYLTDIGSSLYIYSIIVTTNPNLASGSTCCC